MIRCGSGEPVVLLHGVAGSETMWRNVVPLLARHYDVIALTAAGHHGGRPAPAGTTVRDLVDDAERSLDELGLVRPHLVGNSLGGWMAIELARRGRAASVCALSPAGCWDVASGEHEAGAAKLRKAVALARRTRWIMPWAARVSLVRRLALRDNAAHGQRVTAEELLVIVRDVLACTVRDELLTTNEQIVPLDPLPCPVTLAWAEHDRILPIGTIGRRARMLMPRASWRVVPGVGHVPMFDNPGLVEAVIRDTVDAAVSQPQSGGTA